MTFDERVRKIACDFGDEFINIIYYNYINGDIEEIKKTINNLQDVIKFLEEKL